jgi:hypothetical protein
MEFTIGKKKVELSKEKVVEVLKGLEPEPLRGRAYARLRKMDELKRSEGLREI